MSVVYEIGITEKNNQEIEKHPLFVKKPLGFSK